MPDTPRLLHKRSHHGYTDRPDLAMFGEPEAVSSEDQTFLTARVRRSERQNQLQEWAARRASIEQEVAWVYSQHLDREVTRALRTLRRQLEHIDKHLAGR